MNRRKLIPILFAQPNWVLPGKPTLDLNLAVGRAFLSGKQYSGDAAIRSLFSTWSTPAHYATGSDGVLYSVPANSLDASVVSNCQGQLIEEARTNLKPGSESLFSSATYWADSTGSTLTDNNATAPNGTLTASTMADNGASGTHYLGGTLASLSVTSGTVYTQSIFAKAGTDTRVQLTGVATEFSGVGYANFDLSNGTVSATGGTVVASGVIPLANGWYRCWIAQTATGTGTSRGGYIGRLANGTGARLASFAGSSTNIQIYGYQFEAGSFPTSYIPTTTASVTRAASDIRRTLGSEWNTDGTGTMYSEFLVPQVNGSIAWRIVEIDNGTTTMGLRCSGGSNYNAYYSATGSAGSSAITANAVHKFAARFGANDITPYVDGAAKTADTSVTLTSGFNRIILGDIVGGTRSINGYIKRIGLYTSGLADGQLQALTT